MLVEAGQVELPGMARSQRILARVLLVVTGELNEGKPFQEQGATTAIYADGAILQLKNRVQKGQKLNLLLESTGQREACTVVQVETLAGRRVSARVQFSGPRPEFWHVTFPPVDWTRSHPDSKFSKAARVENLVAVSVGA